MSFMLILVVVVVFLVNVSIPAVWIVSCSSVFALVFTFWYIYIEKGRNDFLLLISFASLIVAGITGWEHYLQYMVITTGVTG